MHIHSLEQWRHDHDFNLDTSEGERRTRWVVILTAVMMVVEIIAGYLFGSMALLADGWHMATHVAALAISLFAYRYARKHAQNPRYSFGTGKVSALGGFASAASLAVVALMVGLESIERLISPEEIRFNQAIAVAIAGLAVILPVPGCCKVDMLMLITIIMSMGIITTITTCEQPISMSWPMR